MEQRPDDPYARPPENYGYQYPSTYSPPQQQGYGEPPPFPAPQGEPYYNPYQNPDQQQYGHMAYYPSPEKSGQSWFGVAGILSSLLGIGLIVSFFFMMITMDEAMLNVEDPTTEPKIMVTILLFLAAGFVHVVGLVVSLCGYIETRRGKITVWIGFVMNLLPLLLFLFIILLGILVPV